MGDYEITEADRKIIIFCYNIDIPKPTISEVAFRCGLNFSYCAQRIGLLKMFGLLKTDKINTRVRVVWVDEAVYAEACNSHIDDIEKEKKEIENSEASSQPGDS